MAPLALYLFLKITLSIWGLLWPYTIFMNICFSFVENAIGILVRIALKLQFALGIMNILILLILYIQEHGISYLFKSFSIYFIFVLQFSEYKTLLLWLYLFLSILFFDAIVNVIVFHISLSGSSVLMFRNVTDF